MGPLFFAVLVSGVVVIIGFLIYGMFLGMANLAEQMKRAWRQLKSYETQDIAARERAAAGTAGEVQPERYCWEIKQCSTSRRESCPAYQRSDLPCWLATMQSNPDCRLKPDCLACNLFNIPALMTGV